MKSAERSVASCLNYQPTERYYLSYDTKYLIDYKILLLVLQTEKYEPNIDFLKQTWHTSQRFWHGVYIYIYIPYYSTLKTSSSVIEPGNSVEKRKKSRPDLLCIFSTLSCFFRHDCAITTYVRV